MAGLPPRRKDPVARSRSQRGTAAPAPVPTGLIPTAIVPSVALADLTPRAAQRGLRVLIDGGAVVRAAGRPEQARARLMRGRYAATTLVDLLGTRFYLTDYFQTPQLRFFVAYVVQRAGRSGGAAIHPRIFYKDGSLVWRAASHMVSSADEFWVGKGDVRVWSTRTMEHVKSAEATTDLPLEMQTALEVASRRTVRVRNEQLALELVLRNAPPDRLQAYADFVAPRRRAAAERRNLVHGGRRVAWFRDPRDPGSLTIVPGYEPDYRRGVVERATSTSVLYGGTLRRFRIVSVNRRIQYLFFAGPRQVWLANPQATTTELSSYGVRTIDVWVDDDLCCPGYEYHFVDDSVDPPGFHSQIPAGFAGPAGPHDPDRADASPWLDAMPIVREFRKRCLGARGPAPGAAAAPAVSSET